LDTLLSGTYLNIYSKPGGKEFKDEYIGLNQPYRDTTEGHYFHLVTLHGENVSVGMPIYYKNIKVGQVEYVYLGLDNRSVDSIIFVNKQYVSLVHNDSKFWIKSSFNVDFSKGNFDVNIAPLNFLIQGGIVFSSSGHDKNSTVDADRIFALYDSKTKAESKRIGSSPKKIKAYELVTDQPTANLREGSPVRYAGFDIGWIDDIHVNYNATSHKMSANIIMNIDTSVFENNNEDNITGEDNLYDAVKDGLRARLDTLDIISGMLYIDLTFDHHEENSTILKGQYFGRFPMVEEPSMGMMGSMTRLMDKLSKLPLDKLINSLDKVINEASEPIANANEMLKDLKKSAKDISRLTGKKSFEAMPDEIDKALKELTKTLKTTKKVVNGYGQNSMLTKQLAYTLEILTKTSKEMQVFLRMLNRKPNSLIFGD
jgi:paraquat-inducible protein B